MRPGVGVSVFVRKGQHILIAKRLQSHGANTWQLPGGHLEFGETPEQAAVRETKEEMNITIVNPKVIGATNDIMPAENKHYVTLFVEADYESGELHNNEPTKAADVRWCEPNALPQPLFLPLKNFLENKRLF